MVLADYYPFGEQLPGHNAFSDYRYAFQGQEKDDETGMEAFQLRLWDGRLGKWLSSGKKNYQTAKKLLTDGRFSK
ncbi:RHS repeat-associated core domain-containing protein [Flavobacterium sp. ENC]|uniref:RHS repeat-associated core domain-containing protein n=1 Tax=Flavobacterium sp. ENC TaxID=2897330 RepID=UPI001E46D9F3|nr:RHS repeat-associated core domain-containing protein [Flavobacterium sp. ENC]MCD0464944.1 hypothetical protein [Flavobacterium sp. ENC]